jgi:hypothetical protein
MSCNPIARTLQPPLGGNSKTTLPFLLVSSHFIAEGLFTATAGTSMVFFVLNSLFSLEFQSIKQLLDQLMSSHFIAVGLFTATAGTGNGIWLAYIIFLYLNVELPSSLLVSL